VGVAVAGYVISLEERDEPAAKLVNGKVIETTAKPVE
jgi:hypothetical protein